MHLPYNFMPHLKFENLRRQKEEKEKAVICILILVDVRRPKRPSINLRPTNKERTGGSRMLRPSWISISQRLERIRGSRIHG